VWKEWLGTSIPFLFDDTDTPIFSYNPKQIIINYDIIAAGFYLLSSVQETDHRLQDHMGRFQYAASIQHKLNITQTPVVNYYFDILKKAIEERGKLELKNRVFSAYSLSVCLTHDIDNTENAWIEGGFSALKKGKLLTLLSLFYAKWVKGIDKWFNFEDILNLEKSFGVHSTFYFLPQKTTKGGPKNADYDIIHKKFQGVFKEILSNGSEIGVHGSIGTSLNADKLKDDIRKIPVPVKGVRFHFLQYQPGLTAEVIETAGLKYDTTLGFAEHIGFRNSFCYPFFSYDFSKQKASNVLEIPLAIMDATLYNKSYMGLTTQESKRQVINLFDEVQKFNGLVTILWHNTFFSPYKYNGWRAVYEHILEYATQHNVGIHTAENIYENVTNHNR